MPDILIPLYDCGGNYSASLSQDCLPHPIKAAIAKLPEGVKVEWVTDTQLQYGQDGFHYLVIFRKTTHDICTHPTCQLCGRY